MAGFKDTIRTVCVFLILRKPFVSALTLCMVMAERESSGRGEMLPQMFVYFYILAMFFTGTMLSFANQRSLFALLGAAFTAAFSLISHSIMLTPIKQWIRVRMVARDAAMFGMYLIIASRGTERLERRYRLAWLFQYGCGLLTAFFCITAFQLNRNPEEQGALMLPSIVSDFAKLSLAGLFMVCGLLLVSDWNIKTVSSMLLCAQLLYMVLVEVNIKYWTRRQRLEFWSQVGMSVDSLYILLTLFLIATK
ncbi:hypothetical protein HOLleu_00112 [Holothuria leucospilota]|uniref:Uncharacterized protein n=1 Tax=Holothuria leucospilota TaxID=206669 RepID=A0A9Q1CMJ4_HOLLE|nr:hypothetical protein HOLleu_00112 [Holothuria leucospilota]